MKPFLRLCVTESVSWPVWRAIGPFCILMHANFFPNGCPRLRSCSFLICPPEVIELDGHIADSDLSPNGRIKAVTRSALFIPQTRLNSQTLSPNSFMLLFFFNKVNSGLLAALPKKKASAYWKCSSSASEVEGEGGWVGGQRVWPLTNSSLSAPALSQPQDQIHGLKLSSWGRDQAALAGRRLWNRCPLTSEWP